ncbi:FAD/FMN-containing dehydrogenase [Actinopolyspora alba]|uniref:FAD/FMN-containing dehydrogenase n=1 Tax=Actinopolyspora alba TaxID=673379 RepID=A0A1I2C1D6_9ACTN|nr:FAD-binding oxidoreductase [Actinopolyspora alba]SFE62266.1 FAD/FMN-containing dehydrogenase [Actinopolyspora alba]
MVLVNAAGTAVKNTVLEELRDSIRGELITPTDPDYDARRQIWNGFFQKSPGAIARVDGASDVTKVVKFARENEIELAVKGGGHCFAGTGTVEGGLVLDTSNLRGIRVDPWRRRMVVQPGLLQGDVDAETQSFGLAVTGSQESYIGIGGVTLGGGLGWLARYRGLLVDNMISADVVLANGEMVRASPQDDADLFWAIRGGGGNFGVATSFEFELHPQGQCVAGILGFPIDQTVEVTRRIDEFNQSAPDALTTSFAFLVAPNGEPAVGLGFCHAAPDENTEKLVDQMRGLGTNLVLDHCGTMPYVAVQQLLDDNTIAGHRYYPRSFLLPSLNGEAMQILADGFLNTPSQRSLVGGAQMGGAMLRTASDATPFPHRDGYLTSILPSWTDPSQDEEAIEWTERIYADLLPHTTEGVYANHLGVDAAERVGEAYGDNYKRLAELKSVYDPDNFFHTNVNIKPKA